MDQTTRPRWALRGLLIAAALLAYAAFVRYLLGLVWHGPVD